MDVTSFINLTQEGITTSFQGAARRALLDMWGGEETTLKSDAADVFANSLASMVAQILAPTLARNIAQMIESSKITGRLIGEGPSGPIEIEITSNTITDSNGVLPNTIKAQCV